MKKLAFVGVLMLIAIVLSAENAFAWSPVSFDGAVALATDPYANDPPGLGSTSGFGVGMNLQRKRDEQHAKYVTRADLNYYRWSNSISSVSESHTRMPLFLGRRYFLPWKSYVDVGFEISYVTWKSHYTGPLFGTLSPGSRSKNSDITLGLSAGPGIEFALSRTMTVGVVTRYHWSDTSYATLGLYIGHHF
jgi:opacity protein-like surface antigen